ncbi:MAG TPA: acyl-CoA-binding protein [Streptomyces sp.]|nr:acyl-CoA-binding protein [Streptomyces sp.]
MCDERAEQRAADTAPPANRSFTRAWEDAKAFPALSRSDVMQLHGLYMQAIRGDNTTSEPEEADRAAHEKWHAWTSRAGLSQDDAQQGYIALVGSLTSA